MTFEELAIGDKFYGQYHAPDEVYNYIKPRLTPLTE